MKKYKIKRNKLLATIMESVRIGSGGGYIRCDELLNKTIFALKKIIPKDINEDFIENYETGQLIEPKIRNELRWVRKDLEKSGYWQKSHIRGYWGRPDAAISYDEPIFD